MIKSSVPNTYIGFRRLADPENTYVPLIHPLSIRRKLRHSKSVGFRQLTDPVNYFSYSQGQMIRGHWPS
jgi:hypothetical protein